MKGFDKEDIEGPKVDRRTTIRLLGTAGMVGAATALAGCSGNGSDNGSDATSTNTQEGSEVAQNRIGGQVEAALFTDGLAHLHPYLADTGPARGVANNIRNSLLKINKNGEIVGDVAEDWTFPDDTTFEFDIRTGVQFHNGESLSATDLKYSIEYLQGLEESPIAPKVSVVDSVEVPNDTTLVINLRKPMAPFITFCTRTGGVGSTINQTAIEEMGRDSYDRQPISTGPFQISEWETGEYILLERFDEYFETDGSGNQLPYLDELRFNFIPESSSAWSAMNSEEVQYLDRLSPTLASQAENAEYLRVFGINRAEWFSLMMLANDPQEKKEWAQYVSGEDTTFTDKWQGGEIPTGDPRVRKAIAKALDREDIAQRAYQGWAQPAHTLWNPSIAWLYQENPEPGQYYAPDEARQLLDEAGYTGDTRFTAQLIGLPEREREMTVVQEQLSEVGIDIEVVNLEPSSYWVRVYEYTDQLAGYAGTNDIDPFEAWAKQLHTPEEVDGTAFGIWNEGLYSNGQLDQYIEESMHTLDREERKHICRDAMEVFVEDAPHAMTVFPETPRVINNQLQGVGTQIGLNNFHSAYLQ
jgi:peptide/nickel transport system substrate-binding protein